MWIFEEKLESQKIELQVTTLYISNPVGNGIYEIYYTKQFVAYVIQPAALSYALLSNISVSTRSLFLCTVGVMDGVIKRRCQCDLKLTQVVVCACV
jgi:hypothetical protein